MGKGLYGKTEITPNIIDITIPNDYNVSSINTKQIRVHYVSRENIELGVIKNIQALEDKSKNFAKENGLSVQEVL